jgi:hypothetical protein
VDSEARHSGHQNLNTKASGIANLADAGKKGGAPTTTSDPHTFGGISQQPSIISCPAKIVQYRLTYLQSPESETFQPPKWILNLKGLLGNFKQKLRSNGGAEGDIKACHATRALRKNIFSQKIPPPRKGGRGGYI